MESAEDQLVFDKCSVKVVRNDSQVKVFTVFKENGVDFLALEVKVTEFPNDFISDLDQILLHFTGILVKIRKTEIEKIEPLGELLTEKIRDLIFSSGINKEDLVSILKTRFIQMHSHYDREHSSILIELRKSLIEKCRMPKEITKFLIMTKTIEEANSRFQERVLMMKTHKINEIQTIFQDVYQDFIVDPSQISEEFQTYRQIMKEKKISVFNGWKSEIKDYLKNIIIQARYSWMIVKQSSVKSHIRKVPKNFKLNLSTIDAVLATAGVFEITQCLNVDYGVCLVITSKAEYLEGGDQGGYTEKSLILYYVDQKREAIQEFLERSVKVASGSSRKCFIVLQQYRNVFKMVQHKGKLAETEEFQLGLQTYQTINEIAYVSVTETIVFTTNDNLLFTFANQTLVQLSNSMIYCLRFVSSFNSLVIVSDQGFSFLDSEMKPLINFGLDKTDEIGIFIDGQADFSRFGMTYSKKRLFLCNYSENSILYYKVKLESNYFMPTGRKSIIKTLIEDASALSPTIKGWFRMEQGFDKIELRPGLDVYLASLSSFKSPREERKLEE